MRLNWANWRFIKVDGYGRMGLGFIRALQQAGHEVYPFLIEEVETPGWFQRARGLHFDRVTIQLMPPHNLAHLPGRSIAYTMHESMTLPEGWADHVNQKSEFLIVPSPWLVDLYREGGVKVPIEVVPGGIDPVECEPVLRPGNHPYRFLCLADRANRKSYDLAMTAFYKGFDANNRDVELMIKCRPGSLPGLDFSYSTDPRLIIWKEDVPRIADVYVQADAYICPARCEGFGMTQREAAACGVPTVVGRWFGTADDCDDWAFPLNQYTLVESHMQGCGGLWAEPSLDELIEKMRWLFNNQEEARHQAQVKAGWMRTHATYACAVQRLESVLAHFLHGPVEDQRRYEGETEPAPIKVKQNGHHKHKKQKARVLA